MANIDTMRGMTAAEAGARLARHGPNALPDVSAPSLVAVFLRQFLSPLIYILLAAALVSLALSDIKDAVFIGAVLLSAESSGPAGNTRLRSSPLPILRWGDCNQLLISNFLRKSRLQIHLALRRKHEDW